MVLHSRYATGAASGENRVVEDETRLLVEAGHKVDVWAPTPATGTRAQRLRAGLDAIWSTTATEMVVERVRRFRPDVVHLHNLFPSLSPAVIGPFVHEEIPVVMTLHNYRLMCLSATLLRENRICEECVGKTPWRGVVHRCYRNSLPGSASLGMSLSIHRAAGTFGRVALFVAVSEFVRGRHIAAGLPGGQIVTKPHFSWATTRRHGPGDYFLFAGRLSPEKGAETLVRAWAPSHGRLVVVGDGPERRRLERNASEKIEFHGAVTPDRVAELIARARALLVPSRCYEGAGRIVLEAFAAGVPVVASDLGGLPETVVDDMSGLLVPYEDLAAWAESIARLQVDSESERLGEGAWQSWATGFAPEVALGNLESVYRRATQRTSSEENHG